MKHLFVRSRQKKELKRLFKETAEEGKPLSIMEDAVFKAMLSADTEDSNEALRCLLSACTGRKVVFARVINTELIPAHLDGKTPRLDVLVTFNDGEVANLEMQMRKSNDDLKKRAVIHAAMLLAGQSRRGKGYNVIKHVYQIFFLNCNLFPESTKFSHHYSYREKNDNSQLSDVTEIIFYEMQKLENQVKDVLEGKIDIKSLPEDEKWCMYMKYRHEQHAARMIENLYRQEEGIMRAEKAVNGISRNYLRYMRKMSDIKDSMDRAMDIANMKKYARAEGLAEGKAEERKIWQGILAEKEAKIVELKEKLAKQN